MFEAGRTRSGTSIRQEHTPSVPALRRAATGGTCDATAAVSPGTPRPADELGGDAGHAGGTVSKLVEGAKSGDHTAWKELIDCFLPLIRTIARSYRLNEKDVEDVSQTVCLRMVEHLGSIRQPAALPGWISTIARRESLRVAKKASRICPIDSFVEAKQDRSVDQVEVEMDMLRAEQNQAVRDGLTELPVVQRNLLLLLAAEPPLSYCEISRILDMPVGSIGPTRARCLKRLRETSAVTSMFPEAPRRQAQRRSEKDVGRRPATIRLSLA